MSDINSNIEIMGIVNLTDDSYFADSRCSDYSEAIERVEKLLEEGADIIDVGACSTRPGSMPVGADKEWERLEPFLKNLVKEFPDIRLSLDTYWASVVRKAFDVFGEFIVNDISAGQADASMLATVGELGLTYVAMHMKGTQQTMHNYTDYVSVTQDVLEYFNKFSVKAADHGIKKWILDPGFGFSKTIDQNYQLLRELDKFHDMKCHDGSAARLLVGVSRKSMIYKKFNISPEETLAATQTLHLKALQMGADILRVHDVAEARRTVELYRLLE